MNFYRINHNFNLNVFRDDHNLDLKRGDRVVIKTTNCMEAGTVVCCLGSDEKFSDLLKHNHDSNLDNVKINDANIRKFFYIYKKFDEQDFITEKENRDKEAAAFTTAADLIRQYGLDMALVSVHIFFDNSKVLFNYTSEHRVDFREMLRDLTSRFRSRIELRQIGIRDKSRIIGGYGICGRQICCHNLKCNFNSITIKMVKNQNMPLNTMKISGTCGRLMCCIRYEYDSYMQIQKNMPRPRDLVLYNNSEWEVTGINVQTGAITLKDREGNVKNIDSNTPYKIKKSGFRPDDMNNYLNMADEEIEKLEDK
ncbi:MAG: hypothetical protein A2096_07920 [Spirochaetes bacterium GWF1_41_5]|nr:MAG: hypothetical protein A2096_07920 [Spirochaetes bacterium GWF1_41_5]